eukprot:CAMPEP_0185263480 /NCGR_PEP_ID=MMETSP1359-20130426/15229_1 /TAXON_ID=552665 /ORGANISM="Bigelowiella longifila, Strain CCMP242" /LENGTH=193 /DNA_ID=CAMNT_0027851049 /DNA_START=1 /DNA_END=579 /DNA_ORIENTATION=+
MASKPAMHALIFCPLVAFALISPVNARTSLKGGQEHLNADFEFTHCTAKYLNKTEHLVTDPMDDMISTIKFMEDPKNSVKIRLEPREYGVAYGEIIGKCNKADGNRWDVYLPGSGECGSPGNILQYSKDDNDHLYTVDKVLGVYYLSNGNNKIAISVKETPCEDTKMEEDIKKFHQVYKSKLDHYHKTLQPYW